MWGFRILWWVRKGVLEQSSLGPAAGEQEVEYALLQLTLQSRLALWQVGPQKCLMMLTGLVDGSTHYPSLLFVVVIKH